MSYLIIILFAVAFYCIISSILKVPSFSSSRAYKSDDEKQGFITVFIQNISDKLSSKIKLNIIKKTKLEAMLSLANSKQTAEQFTAYVYVVCALFLCLTPILYFTGNIALTLMPVAISLFFYFYKHSSLRKEGEKRTESIENEIVKFVLYMASAIKFNPNIINCIEAYNMNFDTPLTKELTYTVAEMKTGNYEKALQAMQKRNNSSAISRLVKGLISAMHGNNMEGYFENLSFSLTVKWEESLLKQAKKQEPKIIRLSFIFFGIAITSIMLIMIIALTSSATMLF